MNYFLIGQKYLKSVSIKNSGRICHFCYTCIMNTETKDAMTSMNISLPFSMKEFIEKEVTREGYGTASEFVRELLREAKKRRDEEKLEKLLLEALDSPASPMTKQDWEEIKERGLARIRNKQVK